MEQSQRQIGDDRALATAAFGAHRPGLIWRVLSGRSELGRPARLPESHIRRLRRWLRRSPQIFDLSFDGLRLRLYPSENTCDMTLSLTGHHSAQEEFSRLSDRLSKARSFVDIGANIGLYSLMARARMPADARLIAFEPDPRTVAKLRANLGFNGAGNVTVINAAVGACEETLSLYVASKHNAGRNSLQSSLAIDAPSVQVPVRPLLAVLNEQGITGIDVLKIDVEGHEAEALMLFFETAAQSLWPRYMMMETAHRDLWREDLITWFQARGYTIAFQDALNVHFELPMTER